MKTKQILRTIAVAVGSLLLANSSAKASAIFNAGDLLLLFRTTNAASTPGAVDLYINLGSASSIRALGPGSYNFNAGGFLGADYGLESTDLVNIFGDGVSNSSWNSLSTLVWSVGGSDGNGSNNLYTTSIGATAYKTNNNASAAGIVGNYWNYAKNQPNTQGTLNSATLDAATGSGYSKQIAGPNGTWTRSYDNNGTAPGGNGWSKVETGVVETGASTLNFFYLQGTLPRALQNPLGTFSLSSEGIFTYTVVPEPSTTALVGLGVVGLLVVVRRRQARSAAQS